MIEKANKSDYKQLADIWENAVKATHDFLAPEDFLYYKSRLPVYFENVTLYVFKDDRTSTIKGFLGVSSEKIEMLFVDSGSHGCGIGKKLLEYAVKTLSLTLVDVNKQNDSAVGFYKKFGFIQYADSLSDAEGKSYPIIHMKY